MVKAIRPTALSEALPVGCIEGLGVSVGDGSVVGSVRISVGVTSSGISAVVGVGRGVPVG